MRLLNLFLPPVPVFLYGKPIQGLINILLCLCLWIPGVIHSWGVTTDAKADRRMKKQVKYHVKLDAKMAKADRKDYERQQREIEREDRKEWKREGI